MEADALCYLSLQDLSAQMRTGKLSSVEVTRCILDRIHRMNPRLHAYLTVLDDSALRRAAQADEEIRAGTGADRSMECRLRSRIFARRKEY
jgi:Asp-tRNA(Asn)/Glu-tRNA(Gln) amidotransferase A subunit family amidase